MFHPKIKKLKKFPPKNLVKDSDHHGRMIRYTRVEKGSLRKGKIHIPLGIHQHTRSIFLVFFQWLQLGPLKILICFSGLLGAKGKKPRDGRVVKFAQLLPLLAAPRTRPWSGREQDLLRNKTKSARNNIITE